MPRCLRLHKVPPTARFCAICGARVLQGWLWVGLGALLLALGIGAAVRWSVQLLPMAIPIPTFTTTSQQTFTPTRTTRPIVPPTEIFTPTWTSIPTNADAKAQPKTQTPTRTRRPTRTPTPTPNPSPTASETSTATPYPRAALLTFHGRYVIALGEGYDWVLRQDITPDDPCGWFTLSSQENGKVALLTCYNRYVTAAKTGTTRRDWLLQQESELGECGLFIIHELGNGEVAFETCAGNYFTAGDGNWPAGMQWSVVAETKARLDWERFTLQPP